MKIIPTVGFSESGKGGFCAYRLEGKTPVRCSIMEFAMAQGKQDWIVAQDVIEGVVISTVFLGNDHDWTRRGPPLLFETMLFGKDSVEGMGRCSTWEQAEQMHQDAITTVRALVAGGAQPQIEDKSDD